MRLIIAGVIAIFAIVSYLNMRSTNPVTGQSQFVALSIDQEIALGLQAAPEMAAQHGGEDPDPETRALVATVGAKLVQASLKSDVPYDFNFHALADPQTINAFALPGGQIFITRALLSRLDTEGQLAGILAHEIGHVIERHGAEHLAKGKLTQGLVGAAGVAAYDPNRPGSQYAAAIAAAIGSLVNMKYGRDDELESDAWGVRIMADAGYDPRSMIRVMEILAESAGENRRAEFFSTHPNPENRIAQIHAAIQRIFPDGVPEHLIP